MGQRPRGAWVCIDEVQKVPALLDGVHRLIELRGWRFALSGSSARKLLRQGANLLAGRASIRRLEAFSAAEIGNRFNLGHALQWGTLPIVVGERGAARDVLDAYVHTYIREEIKGKRAPLNGQVVSFENVGRDAHVARKSVTQYLSLQRTR